MSYLYDEIFDSFERSYDDYLHGDRNFYDAAAPDAASLYEEQEQYAANLTDPAATGYDDRDIPLPDDADAPPLLMQHEPAPPKPAAKPAAAPAAAAADPAASGYDDRDIPLPDDADAPPKQPDAAFAGNRKMTYEELVGMAEQERRQTDAAVASPPQTEPFDQRRGLETPAALQELQRPDTLLRTVPSDELLTRCFPRKRFLADGLLAPGLSVLAGSPKVGKSWLVLHLCMQVAKGEPFLGLNTTQGSVLYIALEDDNRRLQDRIYTITDEGSPRLHLVTECAPIGDRLDEEITDFVRHYRDTRLVVIDTFQKIREQGRELSYANDYTEVSFLKKIADYLNICILLVHHTRKQSDNDYMNEISGTNGIAGSADTLMVLKKENRSSRSAILSCTGRDIEDREMKLYLNRETCVWELKSDSLSDAQPQLPAELSALTAYMRKVGCFEGTATAFTEGFNRFEHQTLSVNAVKRLLNRWRYDLEDRGVSFDESRTAKSRILTITYDPKYDKLQQPPARDS